MARRRLNVLATVLPPHCWRRGRRVRESRQKEARRASADGRFMLSRRCAEALGGLARRMEPH